MVAKKSTRTNQSRKPEKEPQERELRRKKPVQSFKMYLYAVLKQVHPTVEISGKAMDTMNTFMFDIFERIVAEVARLVVKGNKQTLASRDMQFAVQLLLPGELAKHAISEGTKAVKKYNQSILTQD